MPGKSHLSAIPSEDVFATGGFTVDPNQTFSALTVPENMIFVLTDVIVFPLVEKSDPDFVVRYRIEEHAPGAPIGTGSKFQYNTWVMLGLGRLLPHVAGPFRPMHGQ